MKPCGLYFITFGTYLFMEILKNINLFSYVVQYVVHVNCYLRYDGYSCYEVFRLQKYRRLASISLKVFSVIFGNLCLRTPSSELFQRIFHARPVHDCFEDCFYYPYLPTAFYRLKEAND